MATFLRSFLKKLVVMFQLRYEKIVIILDIRVQFVYTLLHKSKDMLGGGGL